MKQNSLIKGIPASPGIAIGKAFLYKENKLEIDEKSNLSKEEEIERLVKGREIAKKQLEEIKEKYQEDFKYVLIHDGARPWVSPELIKNVCSSVKKHEAAIPGYRAIDTQKIADKSGKITQHLKRSSVYSVQTPQGFNFEKILSAHKQALGSEKEYTDDSEIYAEFAGDVFICTGEVSNKKITFKEDIK